MGIIIAIGGGDIRKNQTLKINKYILDQCKKRNPKVLLILTASDDSESYYKSLKEKFENMDVSVDDLKLKYNLSSATINKKIMNSDIVYVGGGDTDYMLNIWKKYSIQGTLKKFFNSGGILSGISAGAICWFEEGPSDNYIENNNGEPVLKGLRLLNYSFCPHYSDNWRSQFKKSFGFYKHSAFCVPNNFAICFDNGNFTIISESTNRYENVCFIEKSNCQELKLKTDIFL